MLLYNMADNNKRRTMLMITANTSMTICLCSSDRMFQHQFGFANDRCKTYMRFCNYHKLYTIRSLE